MSAAGERGETARTYGRGGMRGPDMLALQARVSDALAQLARTDAELVKVQGMLKALGGRVLALENPEAGKNLGIMIDHGRPSDAEIATMRKRLKVRALEGIEANKLDPSRAARTYTHKDGLDVK